MSCPHCECNTELSRNPGTFRNYLASEDVSFVQVTYLCGYTVCVDHSDDRTDQEVVGCGSDALAECDRLWKEHLDRLVEGV